MDSKKRMREVAVASFATYRRLQREGRVTLAMAAYRHGRKLLAMSKGGAA